MPAWKGSAFSGVFVTSGPSSEQGGRSLKIAHVKNAVVLRIKAAAAGRQLTAHHKTPKQKKR